MGLGLVFFGMSVMGNAMYPLRSYEPFLDWMVRMEDPLFGILAATLFTALVQSSSATTGVVIVMATQGRTNLDEFVVGSTAEMVVRRSPIPVYTLRAKED